MRLTAALSISVSFNFQTKFAALSRASGVSTAVVPRMTVLFAAKAEIFVRR
jgi:hypothetical protein